MGSRRGGDCAAGGILAVASTGHAAADTPRPPRRRRHPRLRGGGHVGRRQGTYTRPLLSLTLAVFDSETTQRHIERCFHVYKEARGFHPGPRNNTTSQRILVDVLIVTYTCTEDGIVSEYPTKSAQVQSKSGRMTAPAGEPGAILTLADSNGRAAAAAAMFACRWWRER